ncbi:hypothetical protein [Micromonospora sp. WMMD736]|uniref:hypothetical protein n=1 Tax=Micromonospora sp. WMMD736 TaxID=3404112 RepID=UPI003B92DD6A
MTQEYVFDGIATFTARVVAESAQQAADMIRAMQGFEPYALETEDGIQVTELSWGKHLPDELVFVHDEDE